MTSKSCRSHAHFYSTNRQPPQPTVCHIDIWCLTTAKPKFSSHMWRELYHLKVCIELTTAFLFVFMPYLYIDQTRAPEVQNQTSQGCFVSEYTAAHAVCPRICIAGPFNVLQCSSGCINVHTDSTWVIIQSM